jgi:hypothetical protein
MKAYIAYKEWWIQHVAPAEVPSLYYGDDAEQAFKQHVNDLGLYKLMEMLVNWIEDE